MKASELRIGNWYNCWQPSVMKEQPAHFDSFDKWDRFIQDWITGIPLTKELVLQLGFKDQFGSIALGLTASYGACLEWDETEKVVVLLDCDNGVIGEPCYFIHDVQNLYFALERKELPFNLQANG